MFFFFDCARRTPSVDFTPRWTDPVCLMEARPKRSLSMDVYSFDVVMWELAACCEPYRTFFSSFSSFFLCLVWLSLLTAALSGTPAPTDSETETVLSIISKLHSNPSQVHPLILELPRDHEVPSQYMKKCLRCLFLPLFPIPLPAVHSRAQSNTHPLRDVLAQHCPSGASSHVPGAGGTVRAHCVSTQRGWRRLQQQQSVHASEGVTAT